MRNHAPKNYLCPFCELAKEKDNSNGITRKEHIFYRDESTTAFISSDTWPRNHGNVLVIPNTHFENIYDISEHALVDSYITAKKVAIAMKEVYDCDGISMRQHNEPAGNQSVWHFHIHVLPRFTGDNLYLNHDKKERMSDEERIIFAKKLKDYFSK